MSVSTQPVATQNNASVTFKVCKDFSPWGDNGSLVREWLSANGFTADRINTLTAEVTGVACLSDTDRVGLEWKPERREFTQSIGGRQASVVLVPCELEGLSESWDSVGYAITYTLL